MGEFMRRHKAVSGPLVQGALFICASLLIPTSLVAPI